MGKALDDHKQFGGEIRVAARVIDFLSSGLYQSPGSCLKELVNNSYDADATTVLISVKPDADFVAIEDDGEGMTRDQFVTHFSNVAESRKRDSGEETRSGRKKIGKIGIGFIAANELCDEMEIYSTCTGSTDLLHVTIDFGAIRDRPFDSRRATGESIVKADYHGEILTEAPDTHYTKIFLKRLRPPAKEALVSPEPALEGMASKTLYGKKPASVRDVIATLRTFREMDLYSQTRTDVALNVPVPYPLRWVPIEHMAALRPFTGRASALGFKVIYDGVELQKPIVLTAPDEPSIIRILDWQGKHIKVDGYLFARAGSLRPVELNGILVRIREAAVGDYDRGLLGFPNSVHQLFQNWISGELYVEGLEDALNIDRRTLREVEASYVELRTWMRGELDQFLRDVNRRLYSTRSRERNARRAQSQIDEVQEISSNVRKSLGGSAADAISATIAPRPPRKGTRATVNRQTPAPNEPIDSSTELTNLLSDPQTLRLLNKKYSVAQVLKLAVDAASSVLSPEQASKFIAEFARRLRG